jgi:hypothetical protein
MMCNIEKLFRARVKRDENKANCQKEIESQNYDHDEWPKVKNETCCL